MKEDKSKHRFTNYDRAHNLLLHYHLGDAVKHGDFMARALVSVIIVYSTYSVQRSCDTSPVLHLMRVWLKQRRTKALNAVLHSRESHLGKRRQALTWRRVAAIVTSSDGETEQGR